MGFLGVHDWKILGLYLIYFNAFKSAWHLFGTIGTMKMMVYYYFF